MGGQQIPSVSKSRTKQGGGGDFGGVSSSIALRVAYKPTKTLGLLPFCNSIA
jgi:hypothetical protein